MPDVRIVGDAIEVDGVVVAVITETTGTSRREALEDVVRYGHEPTRGGEPNLTGLPTATLPGALPRRGRARP